MNKKKLLGLLICATSLSACVSYNPHGYTNYQAYAYEGSIIYPEDYEGFEGFEQGGYPEQSANQVEVPESYHVGAYHSPAPHKDRDRRWVSRQNPRSYTIELAEGDKASNVARTLYKAPKKERMAQVKYYRGGKIYYKGLYGSYPSYDSAHQALNSLPADIRQRASIKSWGNVQSQVR